MKNVCKYLIKEFRTNPTAAFFGVFATCLFIFIPLFSIAVIAFAISPSIADIFSTIYNGLTEWGRFIVTGGIVTAILYSIIRK